MKPDLRRVLAVVLMAALVFTSLPGIALSNVYAASDPVVTVTVNDVEYPVTITPGSKTGAYDAEVTVPDGTTDAVINVTSDLPLYRASKVAPSGTPMEISGITDGKLIAIQLLINQQRPGGAINLTVNYEKGLTPAIVIKADGAYVNGKRCETTDFYIENLSWVGSPEIFFIVPVTADEPVIAFDMESGLDWEEFQYCHFAEEDEMYYLSSDYMADYLNAGEPFSYDEENEMYINGFCDDAANNPGVIIVPAKDGFNDFERPNEGFVLVYKQVKEHEHSPAAAWSSDSTSHWKACEAEDCPEDGILDKASHSWNSGVVTKAATCKEAGTKTYTCTVCRKTKVEAIAKTSSHTWGDWTTVEESSCLAAGSKTRTCAVCGKEDTQSTGVAAHNWSDWTVTKEATCKAEGEKTRRCLNDGCTAVDTEAIPASSSHVLGEDNICTICGSYKGLFTITGIGYSVEEKLLTDDPIDSQFAGTYRIHLDGDSIKTADWNITMPDGSAVGYANPYSSESWDGTVSYTCRQSWKSKTLAAQIKNSYKEESRYLAAPQSLAAPTKATLGDYASYVLVCFDGKYVDPSKHQIQVSASNVKSSAIAKNIILQSYGDILTPATLDTVFGTEDPHYQYGGQSGYTHRWTYVTGSGSKAVVHTIPEAGLSYEEILGLLKDGQFSVNVAYDKVIYRYIVDWNGGEREDAVPNWYIGKVGEFSAEYWADTLTAEQYEQYKDCYFGYYDVSGAGYVWYDEVFGLTKEKNKAPGSQLVTSFENEAGDEETYVSYLVRPFAEGAICSGWDITYLNDRGLCPTEKYAASRQAKLGNGQPQQIRCAMSSTPIFGDIIVTAQYNAESSIVFALPKGDENHSVTAAHANVYAVGQPLKNDSQIKTFTKVDKDYDAGYDYYALLDSDYQDIWLNFGNGYYVTDPNKALYIETSEGRVYLEKMSGSSDSRAASPRYHLTRNSQGAEMRPDFAAAAACSEDGVVYVHVDENAVKPVSVKVGLLAYENITTGTAKRKGDSGNFRYCKYTGPINEGFDICFFDMDGNPVDTDTFDWGSTVKFKVLKDGEDYSECLRVFSNKTPVIVIGGLEGFDVSDTVPVVTGFEYLHMGESKLENTTLYTDNEMVADDDGFFTYTIDRIFTSVPASRTTEDVYILAIPVESALDEQKIRTAKEIANRAHFKFDFKTADDIKAAADTLRSFLAADLSDEECIAMVDDWAVYTKSYPLFRYKHEGQSVKKLGAEYTIEAFEAVLAASTPASARAVIADGSDFCTKIAAAYSDGNEQYKAEWKEANTIALDAKYEEEVKSNGYTIAKIDIDDIGEQTSMFVDMSEVSGSLLSVNMEVEKLQQLAENEGTLAIKTNVGTVEFSKDAVNTIANSGALAGSGIVNDSSSVYFNLISISAEDIEADNEKVQALSENQKKVILATGRSVIDLTINNSRGAVVPLSETSVTVTVPYTLTEGENPDNVTVWYINSQGRVDYVEGSYSEETGCVTFTTTHFSAYLAVQAVTKKVWVEDK